MNIDGTLVYDWIYIINKYNLIDYVGIEDCNLINNDNISYYKILDVNNSETNKV